MAQAFCEGFESVWSMVLTRVPTSVSSLADTSRPDSEELILCLPIQVFPFAIIVVLQPLFNLFEHLVHRTIEQGRTQFDVEVGETVAMGERAASFFITGDPRLFPAPPSKRFGTMANIRRCGLPYWNPR